MSALGRAAAVAGILFGILIVPPALAHAADDGADDGTSLTVTVTDGSSPTPSPSSSSPVPAGNSGAVPSTGSKGAGSVAPAGGTPGASVTGGGGATAGAVSIAGMVYVGGVNSSVALSPDPAQGDVTLWISIGNDSTSVIDLTVDFWMESALFGIPLDESHAIAVTALQPGEVRAVSTRLHGAGQWTVVNAHATVTPPTTVDGTPLTPVTRDATVLVFPWLIVLLAALTVIGLLTWRAVVNALAAESAGEVTA